MVILWRFEGLTGVLEISIMSYGNTLVFRWDGLTPTNRKKDLECEGSYR